VCDDGGVRIYVQAPHEHALVDPSAEAARRAAAVEQCLASGARFDFTAWSDTDLKHFFVHHFGLFMQGQDPFAALLFVTRDGHQRETHDAHRESGTSGGVGDRNGIVFGSRGGSGGGSTAGAGHSAGAAGDMEVSDQVDEIRQARVVYSAALREGLLENDPHSQSPPPPEETELASMLERAAATGWTGSRARDALDVSRLAEGDETGGSTRQTYGPNGEPLRLLASRVAAAAFGNGGRGRSSNRNSALPAQETRAETAARVAAAGTAEGGGGEAGGGGGEAVGGPEGVSIRRAAHPSTETLNPKLKTFNPNR
jgi:hypothetical protein